jgi:hypothetical protein
VGRIKLTYVVYYSVQNFPRIISWISILKPFFIEKRKKTGVAFSLCVAYSRSLVSQVFTALKKYLLSLIINWIVLGS